MSRIYFHTKDPDLEDAVLAGAERAWFNWLCNHLAIGVLNLRGFRRGEDLGPFLREPLPKDEYGINALETSILIGWRDSPFAYRGEPINAFSLLLNTALAIGSGPLRLAARLHGQCEIHAWVAGPDRAWLADLIDEGLASGVMRRSLGAEPGGKPWSMGWEKVTALLRAASDTPIVTSYSVCDQFPSYQLIEADGLSDERRDAASDAFYDLPYDEQWDRAFAALPGASMLQLRPDDWSTYRFGHELSILDLLRGDEEKVAAALAKGGA